MTNFNDTVLAFNAFIQQNKFIEALDTFYDEQIVSTDNLNAPNVGKAALLTEVKSFMSMASIEKVALVSLIIEDNLSVSNWHYKFSHKTFGLIDTHQISVQRWRSGKNISGASLLHDISTSRQIQ